MSPRTGRPPKKDGKKDQTLQLRLSQETMNILNDCASKLNTTRTAVVEQGIGLVHKNLENK